MSVQELVQQVSYVTNIKGFPTAVQLEIEVWEQIVALLQSPLSETDDPAEGWDAFLSIAADAQPGTLKDPSIHHDSYLYGQQA